MAISVFIHDKNGPKVSTGYSEDIRGTHEVTYAGAVLFTGEENGYDDSDFYALVWDEPTGTVKRIVYATTRGWTYLNGANVDATPEVLTKATAYFEALALSRLKEKAAVAARTPAKGKRVKVVKGRKVPVGLEGTVIWTGEGGYFGPVPKFKNGWSTKGAPRIGFVTDAGEKFFLAASNVDVLDAEEWLPSLDELVEKAKGADIGFYRAMTSPYAMVL